MRNRHDPAKWTACTCLALGLTLAFVFAVPRTWLDFLLPQGGAVVRESAVRPGRWLALLPPPEVEVVPDPVNESDESPPPPAPAVADQWWMSGWQAAAADDPALFRAPAPSAADSTGVVLAALGLGQDFMTRTRPDSVLAARLLLLRLEDGLRFDALKPYLTAMARADDYQAIMANEADLFDEPLAQQILVPD